MTRITGLRTIDVRFPTSQSLDGSDAMNPDPDYSAAYVVLETDGAVQGHGLTFTIGRGNEICITAIEALRANTEGNTKAAFAAAAKAAATGSESTRQMRSVHGRAAYYGDKSIGLLDGGSVVGKLIFEGIDQSL